MLDRAGSTDMTLDRNIVWRIGEDHLGALVAGIPLAVGL
jgi:hypothetical protein